MWSHRFSSCVLLLFSFLASSALFVHAEEAAEWLRGAGKDLEIRLAGEVLDADGRPASDVTVTGALNHQVSPMALEPTVEGHRFEVWIPVNRTHWYSLWLQ